MCACQPLTYLWIAFSTIAAKQNVCKYLSVYICDKLYPTLATCCYATHIAQYERTQAVHTHERRKKNVFVFRFSPHVKMACIRSTFHIWIRLHPMPLTPNEWDKRIFMYRPIGLRFVWPFVSMHYTIHTWATIFERNALAIATVPHHSSVAWRLDIGVHISRTENHDLTTTIDCLQWHCRATISFRYGLTQRHTSDDRTIQALTWNDTHTPLWLTMVPWPTHLLNANPF